LTQCFADAELLSRPIAGLKPEQLVEDEQSKSEDTTEIPNPEIPVSPTETPTTNPPAEITTPTPEPGQAQAEESNIPEQAEKDETVPITDDEVKEQVLGDSNGDLGDAMEDAEKEGKAERKEEQAEEMKQESNTLEEDKTQAVEQDGTKEETDEVKTENTGEKRKRDDEDEKMDIEVEGQAKKARVDEDVEMSSGMTLLPHVHTMDTISLTTPNCFYLSLEPKEEQPVSDPFESISNPLEHAQHPPTTALFIDNFKRPVDLVELRELLESHGELDETVIERGIWLSGVKSHLYVAVSRPHNIK
jgi:cobalamin biosynthesis protein CobT